MGSEVQYSMGRGFNIPWIGVQNTMSTGFRIPWGFNLPYGRGVQFPIVVHTMDES